MLLVSQCESAANSRRECASGAVDVQCMLSITEQILNGKQSSLHRRSQDFVCGALFFREKVDIF